MNVTVKLLVIKKVLVTEVDISLNGYMLKRFDIFSQ